MVIGISVLEISMGEQALMLLSYSPKERSVEE
jgi:hypothetical protein